MSQPDELVSCPNCGYTAEKNYCAQCGQKNHLHKDTAWGLVMHFFEHYFHYDNKFWQTLRALLFKPGKLTTAYWANQRERYISPVSLYIFISAVYFIASHYAFSMQEKKVFDALRGNKFVTADSVNKQPVPKTKTGNIELALKKVQKDPEILKPYIEKLEHDTPKVFFFLIPFTALLLKLFFFKRKEIYFVDHIIFSLHCHSFYFMVGMFYAFITIVPILKVVSLTSIVLYAIYFVVATKNTYQVKTGRAIGAVVFVGLIYFAVYSSISGLYLYYIARTLAAQ